MSKPSAVRIPILMYHQVDELSHPKEPMRGLVVSPRQFASHMGMLKRLGYTGLSMAALEPFLMGKTPCPSKLVGITFDDGYQNNLVHAMPVLQAQGFSATCYMVSGLIGKTNAWDNPNGVPAKPLMTADELRRWQAGGQDVGSHTRTHADLQSLAATNLAEEIAGSRADLQAILGNDAARHFCYPFGRYNAACVQAAADAGYLTATTTLRARASLQDPLLELPRVLVSRTTTSLMLAVKLMTGYEDRRRAKDASY
jgi:peptidoglycan/xylan/chitin deacetylase (PgdA/CDA1 family)